MEINYRKEFYDVIGYMDGRDSPNYRGFEVQRVELKDPNKEIAEKDWQALPEAAPEKYKEFVKKLVGTCSEINPLDWTDPHLSMPIPPILLNDYRKFATHPEIKYGAPDEADFPGMGEMGSMGGMGMGGMGMGGMGMGGYGGEGSMSGGMSGGLDGGMSSGSGSGGLAGGDGGSMMGGGSPGMMGGGSQGGMMGGGAGGMMGGSETNGSGMMGSYGSSPSWTPLRGSVKGPVSAVQARRIANDWLAVQGKGLRAGEPGAMPGYFTMDTSRNGKIDGMLSVNARTGAVWYHWWHGKFVAMEA